VSKKKRPSRIWHGANYSVPKCQIAGLMRFFSVEGNHYSMHCVWNFIAPCHLWSCV